MKRVITFSLFKQKKKVKLKMVFDWKRENSKIKEYK